MHRLRRSLLAAAVVSGALLVSPADAAGEDWAGTMCAVEAVQQETATGQNYEGTMTGGPVVFPADGVQGSLTCYLLVNGVVGPSSYAHADGTLTASLVSTVSYEASDYDDVRVCTEVTTAQGTDVDCDDLMRVSYVSPLLSTHRSHKPGHAHQGGGKTKDHNGNVEDPSPGGDVDTTPDPLYPSGTIEISSNGLGIVNVAYREFNPPLAAWTCPMPSGNSATCVPPAAPVGYVNVCDTTTVTATSLVPGAVTGSTSCTGGAPATATANGPTSPGSSSAAADAEFPWTCTAAPADSVAWTVTCTVGP